MQQKELTAFVKGYECGECGKNFIRFALACDECGMILCHQCQNNHIHSDGKSCVYCSGCFKDK